MTTTNRHIELFAACLLASGWALAACGDDDGPTMTPDMGGADMTSPPPPPVEGGPRDAGTLDAGDDAGPDLDAAPDDGSVSDAGGGTVRIRGVVVTLFGGFVPEAIVRDELHMGVTPSTSDEDGVYTLVVPRGEPLLVVVEHADASPLTSLLPLPPLDADLDGFDVPLGTRDDLDAFRNPLPASAPGTAALLLSFADGATEAFGVQAMRVGGPLEITYNAVEMMMPRFDPTLEASMGGGAFALTEVLDAPEEIVVRATSTAGHGCVALPGWQGSSPDQLRVPVWPDAVTFAGFDCAPPEGRRTVAGTITTFTPAEPVGSGMPLPGVEVCELGTSGCVTSTAGGHYAIDVADGPDVALTYTLAGRLPVLIPLATGTDSRGRNVALPAADYLTSVATAFGATQPATTGAIEFFTTPMGTTVSLASGTGDGPHYLNAGLPDPTLMATGTPGWGFFFGVAEGTAEIAFDHPTGTCADMGDAWESTTAEQVRAPVVPGHLTFASMRCPAP